MDYNKIDVDMYIEIGEKIVKHEVELVLTIDSQARGSIIKQIDRLNNILEHIESIAKS